MTQTETHTELAKYKVVIFQYKYICLWWYIVVVVYSSSGGSGGGGIRDEVSYILLCEG